MSKSSLRQCCTTLCALSLCLLPLTSFAQDETPPPGSGAGVVSGTSSTWSTVIGVPITTTAGVVVLIVVLTKKSSAQLEHYMNHNQKEVQAALYTPDSIQAGTQDLAYLFGVSPANEQDFAELLVKERKALAPTLEDETITSPEAYAFAVHLIAAMQAHPTLSLDVQRQLDAAGISN